MVLNKTTWAGWVFFAGVMLLVTGVLNVVEGFIALSQSTRVVMVEDKLYMIDISGWGWALVIFGAVMLASGLGLFAASSAARIAAIVIVGVHAAVQVFWLGAYPVWSMLMIALDTVVLYALTVRWQEVRTQDTSSATSFGDRTKAT
ncbi:DUF7144 family membrane protein [Kutzneria sp. CA-103260]|uniref:DUF7144 family membrane protein n=1 Tax=Kutzneria sp. CA-103260 TaxID=2802641 RepID=UPI001BAE2A90|nr:hypothetical protein [Kutzneria sp. CA-103260]QUQ66213.1 integral membrane protein [Kutzneria sp. CA-103260]